MLNIIAAVVLLVWTANFAASFFVEDYDGSAINGIFTVIMGAILAIKGKGAGKSPKDEQDDDRDKEPSGSSD